MSGQVKTAGAGHRAPAVMNETPAVAPTNLLALMGQAVERGPEGLDMLERLLAMREREEAREAGRAFARSMVAVHAEMPEIVKTARNDQTRSFYARLEDVDRALRPVYSAHGFAVMFAEAAGAETGWYRLTCTVMHVGGHSVETYGDFPLDTIGPKGSATKTALHGKGSTLTYGRRYLLTGAFNVTPVLPDRDGNAPARPPMAQPVPAGPQVISDAQRRRLRAMQHEAGVPDDVVKSIIAAHGFSSSKLIAGRGAYDAICREIQDWLAAAEANDAAVAGETIDAETGEIVDDEAPF